VTAYRFVEREKASFPVATMCRVLEISPSGYWAWSKRPPSARARSDAELTERIRDIHKASRGTYGMPRIHAELRDTGTRCSRKRVARLMREGGLEGVHRRRSARTTVQDRDTAPAPDLVERLFGASCPNALWVADITYIPTWQGFLYLAVVLDAFSRRVVGWSMAGHLRSELMLDALDMAIDNAVAGSFFASLATELIDRTSFRTRADARLAVFDDIEDFYNPHRRHSAIGYLSSPAGFERKCSTETIAARLTADRPPKRRNSRYPADQEARPSRDGPRFIVVVRTTSVSAPGSRRPG
jgi:putative transposase